MKRLFTGLLAIIVAGFVGYTSIVPAMAQPVKEVILRNSANATATQTGSAVPTVIRQSAISQPSECYGGMMVYLAVTAAASGTLDLTMQGSNDNSNWSTLNPNAAWTQVTTAASYQFRNYPAPLPKYIRYVGTGASTPDHTYGIRAFFIQ